MFLYILVVLVPLLAETLHVLPGQTMVGKIRHVAVEPGDKIIDIAEKFSIGVDAIAAANPNVELMNLKPGTQLLLPTMYLLPSIRKGIVINLSEKRLYYFSSSDTVHVFPVAIGRVNHDSTQGVFSITDKRYQPKWTVPITVLKEEKAKGNNLPKVFESGPENPLGDHAMRLSNGDVLIHGTNFPPSIGKRSTTGCFAMYPEDIAELYEMVKVGTVVTIIDEPIKHADTPYGFMVEAHHSAAMTSNHGFIKYKSFDIEKNVNYLMKKYNYLDELALYEIFKENMGIPLPADKHVNNIQNFRSASRN